MRTHIHVCTHACVYMCTYVHIHVYVCDLMKQASLWSSYLQILPVHELLQF